MPSGVVVVTTRLPSDCCSDDHVPCSISTSPMKRPSKVKLASPRKVIIAIASPSICSANARSSSDIFSLCRSDAMFIIQVPSRYVASAASPEGTVACSAADCATAIDGARASDSATSAAQVSRTMGYRSEYRGRAGSVTDARRAVNQRTSADAGSAACVGAPEAASASATRGIQWAPRAEFTTSTWKRP